MNPIALFISGCLFLATILAMYLAGELNVTISTYGIRRRITQTEFDNAIYFKWFSEREARLRGLWEEEFCSHIKYSFDEFCLAIYNENNIVYID